jgi:hypothetical protein
MVLVWFVLVTLLFKRLAIAHGRKYAAMGYPSLFSRTDASGTWAMLKFLVARGHRSLGDRYLSRLSDGMLVFSLIYLVLFLWLGFGIFGQAFFGARGS